MSKLHRLLDDSVLSTLVLLMFLLAFSVDVTFVESLSNDYVLSIYVLHFLRDCFVVLFLAGLSSGTRFRCLPALLALSLTLSL